MSQGAEVREDFFSGKFAVFRPEAPGEVYFDGKPFASLADAIVAAKFLPDQVCRLPDLVRNADDLFSAGSSSDAAINADWRSRHEELIDQLIRDRLRRSSEARTVLTTAPDGAFVSGPPVLARKLEQVRRDILAGEEPQKWALAVFPVEKDHRLRPQVTLREIFGTAARDQVHQLSVTQSVWSVGKLSSNSVVSKSPTVLRIHFLIFVSSDDGSVKLVDLESTGGTCLAGVRVKPLAPVTVSEGASISLGVASKRRYVVEIDTTAVAEFIARKASTLGIRASVALPPPVVADPQKSTVIVTNLPHDTEKPALLELFTSLGGPIKSARVLKGAGTVEFTHPESAARAVRASGREFQCRAIKVEYARREGMGEVAQHSRVEKVRRPRSRSRAMSPYQWRRKHRSSVSSDPHRTRTATLRARSPFRRSRCPSPSLKKRRRRGSVSIKDSAESIGG